MPLGKASSPIVGSDLPLHIRETLASRAQTALSLHTLTMHTVGKRVTSGNKSSKP